MKNVHNISPVIETRSLAKITEPSGNLYRSLSIISKRANQMNLDQREELHAKLNEFASTTDNLEEIFENREQIEISKFYERLPNSVLQATDEFLEGETYFRMQDAEE